MNLRPMWTFDAWRVCTIHDAVNDRILTWNPEWAPHYLQCAERLADGTVEWDGLLLDGWINLVVL